MTANRRKVTLSIMYMVRRIRMVREMNARGAKPFFVKLIIPLWPTMHISHPTKFLSGEMVHSSRLISSQTAHFSRLIFGRSTLLTRGVALLTREFPLMVGYFASWMVMGSDNALAVTVSVGADMVVLVAGNAGARWVVVRWSMVR